MFSNVVQEQDLVRQGLYAFAAVPAVRVIPLSLHEQDLVHQGLYTPPPLRSRDEGMQHGLLLLIP